MNCEPGMMFCCGLLKICIVTDFGQIFIIPFHSNDTLAKTAFLPPELGVRIAWELTMQYSSSPTAKDSGQEAKQKLTSLEQLSNAHANTAEGRYITGALALIGVICEVLKLKFMGEM